MDSEVPKQVMAGVLFTRKQVTVKHLVAVTGNGHASINQLEALGKQSSCGGLPLERPIEHELFFFSGKEDEIMRDSQPRCAVVWLLCATKSFFKITEKFKRDCRRTPHFHCVCFGRRQSGSCLVL